MLLFQPFFFLLFLLFTSLISFSTSPVIHLNSDLRSLVFGRLNLPPAALSQFPKGYVTKENFQICLENWLDHLKEWNNGELANVESANKIAQDLGFTGATKATSLQLSDPSDNTQQAPWAEGLSLLLLQAIEQLKSHQKATALMSWIFIPDGQAFHFTLVYRKATVKAKTTGRIELDYKNPYYFLVSQLLVPEPAIDSFKDSYVDLDAIYVRHNRDENPERKSQVNDLMTHIHNPVLDIIWYKFMKYPWLRHYVKFGKVVLTELLGDYESMKVSLSEENKKKIDEVKEWLLEEQLKNGGK